MNHRRDGKVRFNPSNGQMLDGIGHYSFELDPKHGQRGTVRVVDVPYLCELDKGIVWGFLAKLGKNPNLEHGSGQCRNHGGRACEYHVSWLD